MLAAMYYAMLCTNWGKLDIFEEKSPVETGDTAFWLKLVAEWITMLLYILSLLAPVICPNRSFD